MSLPLRYACNFAGGVEATPYGSYETNAAALIHCYSYPAKEIIYEIYTYIPEEILPLAPSDQLAILYRATRHRCSPEELAALLFLLQKTKCLVKPSSAVALQAAFEDWDLARIRESPELAPWCRQSGIAPVFWVLVGEVPLLNLAQFRQLSSSELMAYATQLYPAASFRYGDLFYFSARRNSLIAVYDGSQLIHLDDRGSLPAAITLNKVTAATYWQGALGDHTCLWLDTRELVCVEQRDQGMGRPSLLQLREASGRVYWLTMFVGLYSWSRWRSTDTDLLRVTVDRHSGGETGEWYLRDHPCCGWWFGGNNQLPPFI